MTLGRIHVRSKLRPGCTVTALSLYAGCSFVTLISGRQAYVAASKRESYQAAPRERFPASRHRRLRLYRTYPPRPFDKKNRPLFPINLYAVWCIRARGERWHRLIYHGRGMVYFVRNSTSPSVIVISMHCFSQAKGTIPSERTSRCRDTGAKQNF